MLKENFFLSKEEEKIFAIVKEFTMPRKITEWYELEKQKNKNPDNNQIVEKFLNKALQEIKKYEPYESSKINNNIKNQLSKQILNIIEGTYERKTENIRRLHRI